MRALDIHVHPMNKAYARASDLFVSAAQRMFAAWFSARPDEQSAAE